MFIGKIDVFHSTTDDWSLYTGRLQQLFEANEGKKAVSLRVMGDKAHNSLRSLIASQKS